MNLLQVGSQQLIAILLPSQKKPRRWLRFVFLFHVDAENSLLFHLQPFHAESLEGQVDQQELGLGFVGTPSLGPTPWDDQ